MDKPRKYKVHRTSVNRPIGIIAIERHCVTPLTLQKRFRVVIRNKLSMLGKVIPCVVERNDVVRRKRPVAVFTLTESHSERNSPIGNNVNHTERVNSTLCTLHCLTSF